MIFENWLILSKVELLKAYTYTFWGELRLLPLVKMPRTPTSAYPHAIDLANIRGKVNIGFASINEWLVECCQCQD